MRQPRSLLLAALVAVSTAGCAVGPTGLPESRLALPFSRGEPAPPPSPLGERSARLGDPAHFAGLSLTPVAVVEDSRCPAGAQCIQAGTARLSTSIITGGVSTLRVLTLGTPIDVGGRSATLVALCPAPDVRWDVLSREMTATFAVAAAGAPPPPLGVCDPA
jgi:hypothetical protein